MKDEDKKILQDYVNYGNKLNESCEKLRVFLREQERIEKLENQLAKNISILEKVVNGYYDYPHEYLMLIIEKSKQVLHEN